MLFEYHLPELVIALPKGVLEDKLKSAVKIANLTKL